MAIEKTCVQCDNCKNFEPTGLVPFKVKVKIIKEKGWLFIKRFGNDWRHYCPDCKLQFAKSYREMQQTKPKKEPVYWWQKD